MSPELDLAVTEARTAAASGNWDNARGTLGRAIDLAPDSPELHAMMSWCLSHTGGIEAHERDRLVEHHMAVSLDIAPGNPYAHLYAGRMFAEHANLARAKLEFEAALRACPGFAPARDQLARLQPTAVPAPAPAAAPRVHRPRRGHVVALGAALALAVAGAVVFDRVTSDERQLAAFARRLGTTMPLRSVSSDEKDLTIDVGPTWARRSPQERAQEMRRIADGAAALHFANVFVFSNSVPVGEIHAGAICLDRACSTLPMMAVGGSS